MPDGSPPDPARDAAHRIAPLVLGALILALAVAPPETRGAGAIAGAALAALAVVVAALAPTSRWSPSVVVLLALAAPAAVLASGAPGAAVARAALVVAAVAVGSVAAGLGGLTRSRTLAWAVALAGAVPGTHGIWQAIGGLGRTIEALDPVWLEARGGEFAARLDAGRAFAAFPTPAALGGWLALTLPVTLGLARGSSGPRRATAVGLAIVEAAALIATRSVTAAVALAVAAAIAALTSGRREIRRGLFAIVLLGGLAGAVAVIARHGEVFDAGTGSSPLDLRLGNARVAAAMAAAHPWRGVGLGGFGDAYPAYRRAGDNETRFAHSLPMQAVAELGVPIGAAAGLAFLGLFLLPAARRGSYDGPVSAGMAVGLASFALHNLADFTALLPSFALAAACLRGALAPAAGPGDRIRSRGPLTVAASVAALAALAIVALDGTAHDARWRSMALALEGDRPGARRAAERSAALAPWYDDAHAAVAAGALALDPPDLDAARAAADRAVALAPARPALRVLRARVREATGDVPGAWADAERAAALHPVSETEAALRDRLGERVRAWARGGR